MLRDKYALRPSLLLIRMTSLATGSEDSFIFCLASTESQSCAIVAAAIAVISAWSKGGLTSTKSIPMRFKPSMPLIISNACHVASPPATGVPVPIVRIY